MIITIQTGWGLLKSGLDDVKHLPLIHYQLFNWQIQTYPDLIFWSSYNYLGMPGTLLPQFYFISPNSPAGGLSSKFYEHILLSSQ